MMNLQYRPIDQWPGEETRVRRRSSFSAPYGHTLALLERELKHLEARNVVLQVALKEADIRLDGRPRAHARADHPGVILAFDSKHGPLKYAVDTFRTWDENIRAIALALEALRKVDRYGVVRRGEQYTGWKQIESATGDMTRRQAFDLIASYGGTKAALRKTHPDMGGDQEQFERVQQARRLVEA